MNYYYSTDGTEVEGPYSMTELIGFREMGILPDSTQVCAEGQETWKLLSIAFPARPLATVAPIPTSTPWSQRIAEATTVISQLSERIDECLVHEDEYPCEQCKKWVKPFFDYERVSTGGAGFTNEYGVTVFRQNTSTKERIRCRDCGKLLGASGRSIAMQYSSNLRTTQNSLLDLQRRERRWHDLNQLAKHRPYYATFLRILPTSSKILIVLLFIGLFASFLICVSAQYQQQQQQKSALDEQRQQQKDEQRHQREVEKEQAKKERAASKAQTEAN